MESNKDEAERCIDLAVKAISEGRYEAAEKYLHKSERLFATSKAKDLLDKVERLKSSNGSPPPKSTDEPSFKRRAPTGPKKEEKEKDYSPQQLEAVQKVKKCKDYYEILGVSKDSTDSDIKKAYKKLALILHPDKNRAPGAAEAFKAVGNAVAILTDERKRKMYDMYGDEKQASAREHSHHHYESYTRGFESDFTAEELFNMFFGGGFQTGSNVYVRRGNQWRRASPEHSQHHQQREANNYTIVMQMLPVLILIGLSMMSSLLVSDPVYSLNQSSKFPVMRSTMNLKIPYYVKENFHQDYQGSIRRLESLVEEDYLVNLRNACYREKHYRDSMMWKARSTGDQNSMVKAQAMRTPSCDTLMQITRGG